MGIRQLFCTLCLATLFISQVQAQNWRPLSASETYYYQEAGEDHISASIHIEDHDFVIGDSLWRLTEVMEDCDTCQSLGSCPGNDPCYMLQEQAQFLGGLIVQKPWGVYEYRNPGTRIINVTKPLFVPWVWNPENQDMAEVVSLSTETIFGNTDSVKTIAISNGDTIKISKNHGILRWEEDGDVWFLEGIRGRNLGTLLPNMQEMYDIHPGDILQYEQVETFNTPNGRVRDTLIYKDYINSFSVSGNQIQVEVTRHFVRHYFDGMQTIHSSGQSSEILVYSDSMGHPANYHPHAKVRLDGRLSPGSKLDQLTAGIPAFMPLEVYRDDEGLLTKELGILDDSLHGSEYLSFYRDSVFTELMPRFGGGEDMEYFLQFKERIGLSYEKWEGDESSHYRRLTAYVMDEDTVGDLIEDQQLVVYLEDVNEDLLQVGPNPSRGKIAIMSTSNEGQVLLVNLQGQSWDLGLLQKGIRREFDLGSYAKGLYFLELRSESGVFRQKLLLLP